MSLFVFKEMVPCCAAPPDFSSHPAQLSGGLFRGGDNRCVGDAEAGHPCWRRKSDGDELMNSQPTMEEDETNNARHDL